MIYGYLKGVRAVVDHHFLVADQKRDKVIYRKPVPLRIYWEARKGAICITKRGFRKWIEEAVYQEDMTEAYQIIAGSQDYFSQSNKNLRLLTRNTKLLLKRTGYSGYLKKLLSTKLPKSNTE
jgi:hypothetical protein